MLPLNLAEVIQSELLGARREPDGLLHASSDLIGSLRHAQLTVAGAPKVKSEITSELRMMTGTMWHEFVHSALVKRGVPFMQEVKLAPYLPEGWSGTADWVFWHDDYKAFVLGDLKTIKGEGMFWINKGGAKAEHLWQLSAYWHALEAMGVPLVNGFGVLYLPMNDTTDRDEVIEPSVQECSPLPRDLVWGVMEDRWEATQRYISEMGDDLLTVDQRRSLDSHGFGTDTLADIYVTEHLAPEIERVQKLVWNGKQGVFDVKLVPHWSTAYCPFPTELCACSEQPGSEKVGHWTLYNEFVPRDGYDIQPQVRPSMGELNKRLEEVAA